MKKLAFLLILLLSACSPPENAKLNSTTGLPNSVVETITVENCEYFVVNENYGQLSLVHKGNCKNQIHYCDKVTSIEREHEEIKTINKALQDKVNQQEDTIKSLLEEIRLKQK